MRRSWPERRSACPRRGSFCEPGVRGATARPMEALQRDLGVEDRNRLTDDPHRRERAVAKFELDVDPTGTAQVVTLCTGEARSVVFAPEQLVVREVRTEETVRVA